MCHSGKKEKRKKKPSVFVAKNRDGKKEHKLDPVRPGAGPAGTLHPCNHG